MKKGKRAFEFLNWKRRKPLTRLPSVSPLINCQDSGVIFKKNSKIIGKCPK